MYTLIGIGTVAVVFLVLGLVALIRCDRADIPETVRALSRLLGHPDNPASLPEHRPQRVTEEAEGTGLDGLTPKQQSWPPNKS